ncbi:hypothetical protein [Caulobacter segnis]
MRFKKLRVFAAVTAAIAFTQVAVPAQSRILLSTCERWAWDDCEASYGRYSDEFAVCYEARRKEFCPPINIPYPITW